MERKSPMNEKSVEKKLKVIDSFNIMAMYYNTKYACHSSAIVFISFLLSFLLSLLIYGYIQRFMTIQAIQVPSSWPKFCIKNVSSES